MLRFVLLCLLLLISGAADVQPLSAQGARTSPTAGQAAPDTLLLIFMGVAEEEFSGQPWELLFHNRSGVGTGAGQSRFGMVEAKFDPQVVAEGFRGFLRSLHPVVAQASEALGDYSLDQIELNVSITAEGKVGLVASSTLGVAGGIKVILKRKAS